MASTDAPQFTLQPVPAEDLRRIQKALETALWAMTSEENVIVVNKALTIVLDHLGSPFVTDEMRRTCRE